MERLTLAKIKQAISPHHAELLEKIILLEEVSSTNDYLLSQARHSPESNLVCLAEQQTAGKGRLGRQWVSPYAENIYLSMLWHFSFPVSALTGLNIVVAVSVAEAIKQATPVTDIQLKWPNDIYWQGRKLGGILIEICPDFRNHCAVVIGIGLNVAMDEVDGSTIEKPWTTLSQAAQTPLNRNALTGTLIDTLLVNLVHYQKHGALGFVKKWNKMDYLLGKATKVMAGTNVLQGEAAGVNELGQLLLNQPDGTQFTASAGESSVM